MYNYNPYQSYFQQSQGRQNQDERIWVQNQAGAEAYLLAPNAFVRLWDSSEPVFYEKRSDASGRPYPMEVYEYKRREVARPIVSEGLRNSILNEIESLKSRLVALEQKGARYESNANDRAVQPISEHFQRQSTGGSAETSELRSNDTATV